MFTWAALFHFFHDQVAHVAQQHAVHGAEAVLLAIRHTPAPVKEILSTLHRDLVICCMLWLDRWQQHSLPAAQPGSLKQLHACKLPGVQLAC